MAHEPKRRHSTERKGQRRAAIKLSAPKAIICSNCGAPAKPHTVCAVCGYYKGKPVIAKKQKTTVKRVA